jgi:hypothetical protein
MAKAYKPLRVWHLHATDQQYQAKVDMLCVSLGIAKERAAKMATQNGLPMGEWSSPQHGTNNHYHAVAQGQNYALHFDIQRREVVAE